MDELSHPCNILTAQGKVLDAIGQLRKKPSGHRTTYFYETSYEAHMAYQMWQELGQDFTIYPLEQIGEGEFLFTVANY